MRRRNNDQYLMIVGSIAVLLLGSLYIGRLRIDPRLAEGLVFFTFLLLFEFLLVYLDPYVMSVTDGVPIPTLLLNAVLALGFTFLHRVVERKINSTQAKQ